MTTYFVYRLYDADDQLLYVGFTKDVSSRMRDHRKTKPWFAEVVRTVTHEYRTYDAAKWAETVWIRRKSPPHNTISNTQLRRERHWRREDCRWGGCATCRPKRNPRVMVK